MNSVPGWLWFLIAILVILAILFLIGVRVNVG
jgi:hypothetical protein